ncbi:MAG TPA: HAMP domain-containing sensor histidine kinase [Acidobacteriaceae bacterium]|nr:HAMP domain-containing sensor histidine kinase [Acidobacteriaceae bacterium]
MTEDSPIRLLCVVSSPAVSGSLRTHLESAGPPYQVSSVSRREVFLENLSGDPPDLILVEERGIRELAAEEVIYASRKHSPPIPIIVIGERGRDSSATGIFLRGASDYVELKEIEHLSSAIQRSIREQQIKTNQALLEVEMQHAAGLLQENQRLMTIGRLTGSIAHEINNPLESVINLLFLIEHEAGLSGKVRGYLSMAQKELDRVTQISKQTLNFYRDTSAPVPIRLSTLLDEVLVLYGRRIVEKQLEVERRFGSEDTLTIFPGEFRQVFSNLITNAIEASSAKGKLYLRIRRSHLWGDAGIVGVRVTVADNGSGMTPEVRDQIGKAFFTTKGHAGTGLGLWVSMSIIERYGGNLLVRSSTGRHHGTVFSIFLPTNLRPQVVANAEPETVSSAAESHLGGSGKGSREASARAAEAGGALRSLRLVRSR